MNATLALLDRWKAAKGIETDTDAAERLGISKQAVSHYRKGIRHAEPETIRKLALALKEDPELWVLKVQADRETIPERKAVWLRCVERLATAAVVCLAVYTSMHIDGSNGEVAYLTIMGLSRHCAPFVAVACIVLGFWLLQNAEDRRHGTAAVR